MGIQECPMINKCNAASGINCKERSFLDCHFFIALVLEKIYPGYIMMRRVDYDNLPKRLASSYVDYCFDHFQTCRTKDLERMGFKLPKKNTY